MKQIVYAYFCLAFALAGACFRDEFHYVRPVR